MSCHNTTLVKPGLAPNYEIQPIHLRGSIQDLRRARSSTSTYLPPCQATPVCPPHNTECWSLTSLLFCPGMPILYLKSASPTSSHSPRLDKVLSYDHSNTFIVPLVISPQHFSNFRHGLTGIRKSSNINACLKVLKDALDHEEGRL